MNERLGIIEERAAWRDTVLSTARISQAARARIMGRQPRYQPAAQTHTITVDCAKPDERKIEEGAPKVAKPAPPAVVEVEIRPSGITIASVQWEFLDALWEVGYRIKSRRFMREDLVCKARARVYSWPRHVCIDLVRRICPGLDRDTPISSPKIGMNFGRMDHTSVLYAFKHWSEHTEEWPLLAAAHAKVLATFEAKKQ